MYGWAIKLVVGRFVAFTKAISNTNAKKKEIKDDTNHTTGAIAPEPCLYKYKLVDSRDKDSYRTVTRAAVCRDPLRGAALRRAFMNLSCVRRLSLLLLEREYTALSFHTAACMHACVYASERVCVYEREYACMYMCAHSCVVG